MKGILLAGGKGSRLLPATKVVNKHMIPILNKPMIMYPLETLKSLGITDIMIISGGEHIGGIADFLGDGSELGVNLTYRIQREASGIAQALSLAEAFVGDEQFAVILGDNIFDNNIAIPIPQKCGIVLKHVDDPRRFGVLTVNNMTGVKKIIEKPKEIPASDVPPMAVIGLYFYTSEVFDFIRTLEPSERGELEITDVNNYCLATLPTDIITYEGYWSDAGTVDSLKDVTDWAYENGK